MKTEEAQVLMEGREPGQEATTVEAERDPKKGAPVPSGGERVIKDHLAQEIM